MKKYNGLTANTLKLIAMITMLIDHAGASLIWQMVTKKDEVYILYRTMRYIGRLAFPIYCFFIVEGLIHTRNVKKYLIRLLIFAFVSEVPFDYALLGKFTMTYQNVFFTLALGLVCIWGFQFIEEKLPEYLWQKWKIKSGEKLPVSFWQILCKVVVLMVTYQAAEWMHTDYGGFGVAIIAVLYLLRKNHATQCMAGAVGFYWEVTAPLSFVLLYFYNGEKGKPVNKFLFYGFYPIHLAVLAVVRGVFF